jgi:secreted PhoX family phosphatase
MTNRRDLIVGLAGTAFGGLLSACSAPPRSSQPARAYGPLLPDPDGLLDLPAGFAYRVISRQGELMDDGFVVPDYADGMDCFALSGGRVALVRNHELQAIQHELGPFARKPSAGLAVFDSDAQGRALPGGTTTLVYDVAAGRVVSQYLSLAGTIRNCAGGATPWGSWLTCEEDVTRAGQRVGRDHGWVFEVPANLRGLAAPIPLTALGRFNHEAAAVDPGTGIVYLTEDRDNGLLYRLLPHAKGELVRGGRLQALALMDSGLVDSRNWTARELAHKTWYTTRWIDLDNVGSPEDDLRIRGHDKGALLFARGEGIHFGNGEFYFCCTSGGAAKLGQVMRYRPSRQEGTPAERRSPGRLQVFVESTDPAVFNFGDNLTVAPNGHLIVCEDQYTDVVSNHLRGVTLSGEVYTFALLRSQTELAGACFSPDGSTLFVNAYSPGRTFAIKGPWAAFRS